MAATDKFTEKDRQLIVAAIEEAELATSGEIRLFIEDDCGDHVLDRAAFMFHQLGMDKTKDRNGVLFYLALESRQFAILGDKGINEKTGADFWHDIKHHMQNHFTEGHFAVGLTKGIKMAGEALSKHFPYKEGDRNELTNDIVFG
jgi:uncharacterized membrane protein